MPAANLSAVAEDDIPLVKYLGLVECALTWRFMQAFTAARDAHTRDEIWVLQHPPVFTLGLAGKREHLLRQSDIPVLPIDRGGQVTYHGPGQLVIYLMLDLARRAYGVRELVTRMEQSILDLLFSYGIQGQRKDKAPGVYVNEAKIAALGLRVKHARTYHGLALNVDMDLAPFSDINPCGYQGMRVTQLRDQAVTDTPEAVAARLIPILIGHLQAQKKN